nr:immunoglobulin light chain junction region [Macaca mulatta]
CQHSNDTPYTF